MATVSENQYKYLSNLAAGKTESGNTANAGQIAWAKSQLSGVTAPVAQKTETSPLYQAYQTQQGQTSGSAGSSSSGAGGSVIGNASNSSSNVSGTGMTTSTPAPDTNYGGKGNPLNEILFSKKQYDSGNKLWAAKNAQSYYDQLDPQERSLVQGMNTQQLEAYINSKNTGGTGATGATGSNGQGSSSLINEMYDNSLAAQLQALRKARETAQQGLNSVETTAKQSAYQNRNLADASTQQSAQRLRTIMAEQGLLASGDNVTANVALQAAGQNNLNAINQAEANTLQDVMERRATINNNAELDEQALAKEVAAARANALIQDQYHQDDMGLQVAGLTGTYNGTRTLAGVASDQAAQQQSWSQSFQKEQFAYQKARDAIADKQYQQQFDENVRQYGLNYGLQKAMQDHQISYDDAQLALSQSNTSTDNSRQDTNSTYSRLFDIWQLTGVAPAGLEAFGIAAGTPVKSDTTSSGSKTSAYDTTVKNLDTMAVYKKDDYSNNILQNAKAVETAILQSGLSEYEMWQLYNRYQIPWTGDVPKNTAGN
ncbi:hypothetical protein [Cohnella sp. GCM10012308]|uniref:hypothetical protein n=1 Tax=Cohnella sp. GCM10012308 TaxID=3317329 RepID=UPI0036156907